MLPVGANSLREPRNSKENRDNMESKECIACGTVFYRLSRHDCNWNKRKYCQKSCGKKYAGAIYDKEHRITILKRSYAMPVTTSGKHMPTRAVTPGQRMRWLRLSESACGKKIQVTAEYVSHKTGLTTDEIAELEIGPASAIMSDVHRMVCKTMKWPVKLLEVDEEVWLDEVRKARLTSGPERPKF